jgi:hypothetical protein
VRRFAGRHRRIAVAALFGVLGALIVACLPSVSRVYEGDVRFERCMALDWKETVSADIRRECWQEWRQYFTLGQTRDRIEYAEREIERLSNGGQEVAVNDLAVPEPTSVFAPPPMMMAVDGGADAPVSLDEPADAAAVPMSCTDRCDTDGITCLSPCRSNACRSRCANTRFKCYKACLALGPDGG